jgi:cytochrome P450
VSARAVLRLFVPSFVASLYKRRRFREANRHFDRILDDVLEAAERGAAAGQPTTPVMRILLDALAKGDLSRDEVREEIFGLLIAGHETSATALTWIIALLAQNRDVQNRCRAQIEEADLDRHPLDYAALERLTVLGQVVQEALRLFPPVPISLRTTTQDGPCAGLSMPKGTQLHIYSALTHRDPRFWTDGARFDPNRFRSGATGMISKCQYFPFLIGPHTCIGMHLALMELLTVSARLLWHFSIDFHGELRADFRVSLHPSGFTISLRPRTQRLGSRRGAEGRRPSTPTTESYRE